KVGRWRWRPATAFLAQRSRRGGDPLASDDETRVANRFRARARAKSASKKREAGQVQPCPTCPACLRNWPYPISPIRPMTQRRKNKIAEQNRRSVSDCLRPSPHARSTFAA